MFVKLVSLTSLMTALAIFSVDATDPSDPLFYIVSGGVIHELFRFALIAILFIGAFAKLPNTRRFRISMAVFGWPLIILGAAGFLTNSFDYVWYGILKPLDFFFIVETGLVMNILALEPQKSAHFSLLPFRKSFSISALNLRLRQIKSAH